MGEGAAMVRATSESLSQAFSWLFCSLKTHFDQKRALNDSAGGPAVGNRSPV